MRPIRTTIPTLAVTAALILATGCGDRSADPGEGVIQPPETDSSGTMRAWVTDDPGSGAAASSGPSATFAGTLSGTADVEVSADEKTWYTMGAAEEFAIPLQSDTTVQMTGAVDLPPDTYRFIRINFGGVEALLEAGSTVDGATLESAVHLRLGDTGNAVTRQEVEAFELGPGTSARIVLDLNSERWVNAENLERREIPKERFEEQARIEIVGES